MHSTSHFLQGIYSFEGHGLRKAVLIDPALTYTVPPGTTGQALTSGAETAPMR
jgi:assimilatory nitrate reductase catalytic subunit